MYFARVHYWFKPLKRCSIRQETKCFFFILKSSEMSQLALHIVSCVVCCLHAVLDACYLLGDVHVLTLDGPSLHVQGNCSYTLVDHPTSTGSIPAFNVISKLEHCDGNTAVSYVEWVDIEIEIYGYVFRLDKDKKVYMLSCKYTIVKFTLKVIYYPLYSMNKFVTNKSKLPQDRA